MDIKAIYMSKARSYYVRKMQAMRRQLVAGEEVLWEEIFPVDLELSKNQEIRTTKIIVGVFILPSLGFIIGCWVNLGLLISARIVDPLLISARIVDPFAIVLGVTSFFISLFYVLFYLWFRAWRERFDRIESWYGDGALGQYEKAIMITNYRFFFRNVNVRSWKIDPLRKDIWHEKDIIAYPVASLHTILVGRSEHGRTDLRIPIKDISATTEYPAVKFNLPALAVAKVCQILCQLNPEIAIESDPVCTAVAM
jgi:hypothetical protein